MRAIGDLIYVQKQEKVSLHFLLVLFCLKSPVTLPMNLDISVGMYSFLIKLEDIGEPINYPNWLWSKLVGPFMICNQSYPIHVDVIAPMSGCVVNSLTMLTMSQVYGSQK